MAMPTGKSNAKFWNIASVSGDEGEIVLYGDIVRRQPIDWRTGELKKGLYITPEGFMDDLAIVKDKANITVKLNSVGGDLYTGIAIHNVLKALTGNVDIVVEGIAASAASIIMCAGNTVTVYPGSLVMVHGVSVEFWDRVDIPALEQLIKGMDAAERAAAEIYSKKTGIEVETLRSMMTEETWMTGQEAVDKGFADICEGEASNMCMSADRKTLTVNGVTHSAEWLRNIPNAIPVSAKASDIQKNEGRKTAMNLEELRNSHPELVSQIEEAAALNASAAERERLCAIESIEAAVGDPDMIAEAKYGKDKCTAQELSFRAMQKHAKNNTAFLAGLKADVEASGTSDVGANPGVEGLEGKTSAENEDYIKAMVAAYSQMKGSV